MNKIEHIGIAVNSLEQANNLYAQLLGEAPYKSEAVESEKVITSFFKNGPNKIELLAATDESSAIAKFIEKKGEGIHHIAFAVDNIYEEMARLSKAGFQLLSATPKKVPIINWFVLCIRNRHMVCWLSCVRKLNSKNVTYNAKGFAVAF